MRKIITLTILLLCFSLKSYSQTLHLYGGKNNDEYLGCLNCDKFNSNSIWNAFGNYGSKFNSNSIWNAYGTYGSKYNQSSPWNANSQTPPVVVDKEGNFYGYFTMNQFINNRAKFDLALTIYEYHEFIMDDVSKWYDKFFK